MPRKKQTKPVPKRWLFHGILSDAPLSGEDSYLDEEYLGQILKGISLYPGLRVTTLRLTPLPERQKKPAKSVEKQPESGPNAPWNKT